jgi:hypothetical protein
VHVENYHFKLHGLNGPCGEWCDLPVPNALYVSTDYATALWNNIDSGSLIIFKSKSQRNRIN